MDMEDIIYVASDGSGMTESDLVCHLRFLKEENENFCFSHCFDEEDFLDQVAYERLTYLFQ